MADQQESPPQSVEPRAFMPRRVRNVAMSVIILFVLLLGGGVIYIKMSDNQSVTETAAVVHTVTAAETAQPAMPSPKAAEGAAIDMLTSPVARGAQASISVSTNAGSTCKISVMYNKVPSAAAGLGQQTADDYGSVEWTWTVDKTAPVGTWPVTVTCLYHGRSGVVIGNLQVT